MGATCNYRCRSTVMEDSLNLLQTCLRSNVNRE